MLVFPHDAETSEKHSKFDTIYLRYRDKMFACAYSVLHNEADAEDAVQMAFVKIYECIDLVPALSDPRLGGYLNTIVERKAIDIYRKNKRIVPLSEADSAAGIQIDCTDAGVLAQCIAALPANYRQVVLLRYAGGYSASETAYMLGLSTANVRKLEQRAKAKLEILCKEAQLL